MNLIVTSILIKKTIGATAMGHEEEGWGTNLFIMGAL